MAGTTPGAAGTTPGAAGTPREAGTAGAGAGLWRGRPVRLLLVVDAALLVLLLVVALLTRGAGGQEPAASPEVSSTSTTGAAGGPVSTPAGSATPQSSSSSSSTSRPDRFVTPSGNIACVLNAGSATCAIHSPTFTEPALEGCAQAGRAVIVDTTGVQVLCPDVLADDPFAGDPAELAYGSTTTVGTYTCTSATNGVTCVDSSGVGFRLARASLTMLP